MTQIYKAAKIILCDVDGTRNTNLLYKFQGRAILNGITYAEQRKINKDKSDISYLKNSRAFDIPIHSRALLAAILCWLATKCGHAMIDTYRHAKCKVILEARFHGAYLTSV